MPILSVFAIVVEWLHFHVKIKYLKPECIEIRKYITWIAWSCKNCVGLFKFNLLLSYKFTTKWKAIQKMDGNWSVEKSSLVNDWTSSNENSKHISERDSVRHLI